MLGLAVAYAQDEPTLDKILNNVQDKEKIEQLKKDEQAKREQELRDAAARERQADADEKAAKQLTFEQDYQKYSAIKMSPQASEDDRSLAWKVLCRKWLPGFEECHAVNLVWNQLENAPRPAGYGDAAILLAGINPSDFKNDFFKKQVEGILRGFWIPSGYSFIGNVSVSVEGNTLGTSLFVRSGEPSATQDIYRTIVQALSGGVFGQHSIESQNQTLALGVVYEKQIIQVIDPKASLQTIEASHTYLNGLGPEIEIKLIYRDSEQTTQTETQQPANVAEEMFVCPKCNGTGICQACNGTGKVKAVVHWTFGMAHQDATCVVCNGTGKCEFCKGTGKVNLATYKLLTENH